MTEKENYMRAVYGKDHPWVPELRAATEGFFPEYLMQVNPDTGRNLLGVEYRFDNENGMISNHAKALLKDIREWRDKVKLPDPATFDWKAMADKFNARCNPEKAKTAMVQPGLFLYLVDLLGWVEGLCALAEEPETVKEFHEYVTQFIEKNVKLVIEHIRPDVMGLGDDEANEKGPFMSQSCFRELYKPFYTRIVKVATDEGIPVDFHNCGKCEFLLDEMTEMGIQVVQIPRPYEDLRAWKKKNGRNRCLEGGWDWQSKGGLPNATEAEVRASARDTLDSWARNDPAFIFWEGDAIGQGKDMANKVIWARDEVAKYGKDFYR